MRRVALLLLLLCTYYPASYANEYSSTSAQLDNHLHHVFRRRLDDAAAGDDDAAAAQDDAAAADDAADDDLTTGDNEMCAKYLFSFLEGATDARDTCEGIMNAYVAAKCKGSDYSSYSGQDDDDYFNRFAEKQCCQALQKHHSDYCEEGNLLSNAHLFISAAVLLMCECMKVVVTKFGINFLPEAAVCILVGVFVGALAHLIPNNRSIDDLSFDDELFLSLLLPPIIFEAALSVSKYEFKRRRGAILMFSVLGTIISTFSSGLMVHYASRWSSATTFPVLDSLVFGALISSIDPVAILSVLSSLNLDQKDTIFILVFGESLLNDGIAITVFQTLANRFDGRTSDGTTSLDEILEALASFLISMFVSIAVGLACGCGAWVYFNCLGDMLPPVMEVGSFFLWALIPYYICDGLGWSGIVSIVVVGFFMDIYIAGPKRESSSVEHRENLMDYHNFSHDSDSTRITRDSAPTVRSMNPLPRTERIHLSNTANKHVRFVAHLTSTLAENAIFSYLGLFLFSSNYDWDPTLISISIVSCILSRALMVCIVAFVIFNVYRCRGVDSSGVGHNSSRTAAAIQDRRTQAVLVLAGLRGAVSLALVENVPVYNHVTGEGCEFKQVMKGMTSACILFTTFVFGGGAYYILPHLGVQRDGMIDVEVETPPSSNNRPTITVMDKCNNESSMTFHSASA